MIIRQILDNSDIEQTKQLYFSYDKFMRTLIDTTEGNFVSWLDQGGKYVEVYGAFVNGELIGLMRSRKWQSLPVFALSSLFTKKGMFALYNYTDDHPSPFLLDHILEKYEANGYYTWYGHRQIRPAYYRLTTRNKDLLSICNLGWDSVKEQCRYNRTVEEIVKTGSEAAWPIHRSLLREQIWNNDILIFKCSLKQEYRKTLDIFQ